MRTAEEQIPLSPEQRAILFESLNHGTGAYAVQLRCSVRPFEPRLFDRAWRRVVARHDALRLTVRWTGRPRPAQVVQHDPPAAVRTCYVRGVGPDRLREVAFELFAEDFAIEPDLESDRLVTVSAVYSDDVAYAAWNSHHIVLDGLSSRLMLADFTQEYDALLAGEPRPAVPGGSFAAYLRWRRGRPEPARAVVPARQPEPSAVFAILRPVPAEQTSTRRVIAFPDGLTARMRAFSRRTGITPATQFHAAWALAVARLSGRRRIRFGTTSYGRPPELPGADTALGMFITTRSMSCRLDPDASAESWLNEVQHDLVSTWDGHRDDGPLGTDPVVVVSHFAPVEAFRGERSGATVDIVDGVDRTPHPVVATVYIGQPAVVVLNINGIEPAAGTPELLVEETFARLTALSTYLSGGLKPIKELLEG